ncbi:hypothetical protein [Desertimonas flava]|uniref:hypothetical protein n=1 Tax=Desertimonas flava TaxID=2064846 RepID=UPI0013C417EF|nr:hypothetical protein [Desertimonas flava]
MLAGLAVVTADGAVDVGGVDALPMPAGPTTITLTAAASTGIDTNVFDIMTDLT